MMAAIHERYRRAVGRTVPATASGTDPATASEADSPVADDRMSGTRDLIGLSVSQLEWAIVAIRIIWIAAAVAMALTVSSMESVRIVWLTAGLAILAYGIGMAALLHAGAIRGAALLGIALDAAAVTIILPAVVFVASRDDPANLSAAIQPALAVTGLAVIVSVVRLRLIPAIALGIFLTVVPVMIAMLLLETGVASSGLLEGAARIVVGGLIMGILGQVLQRTQVDLARQVAQTRHLFGEAERRAGERQLLADLGRIVSESPDVRQTYERFAETVRTVLPADRVSVNIYDPEREVVTTTYVSGVAIAAWEENASHPVDETPLGPVVRDGRSILIGGAEYEASSVASLAAAASAGLSTAIAVPLQHQGVVIGTLSLRSRDPHAYDESSLGLLERIGAQIAPAVANALLYEARERDAAERAVFAEISRILSASPDIADVYEDFVEKVSKLINWDRISVNVLEQQTGLLRTAYAAGLEIAAYPTGLPRPAGHKGILEHIVQSAESLLVHDLREVQERFPGSNVAVEAGLRSGIYVPLISDGEVIGTLAAGVGQVHGFSEADLGLFQRMASQAAGTIANAELRTRLDRQAGEEAALAEIGRIINSSLDIEVVYEQFASQVALILNFDRLAITRIGPGEGEFTIAHTTGVEIPGLEAGSVWKLAETPFGPVLNDGETLIFQGKDADPDAVSMRGMAQSTAAGIRSNVIVPIIERDKPVGFFNVRSLKENAYTEADAVLARRVAALVSSAITNAELLERSDRQANEESVLAEIGRIVNSSLDIETVYEQFAEQVSRVLKFDRLAIARLGPGEEHFTIAHVTGVAVPGIVTGSVWKISETPFGPVLKDGETLFLEGTTSNVPSVPMEASTGGTAAGIQSSVVVPLIERDRIVGFFNVRAVTEGAYTETDAILARRVAALVSSAITNAELLARSEEQARQESALGEIGRIINSSFDIEEVYDQFAEQVQRILPFDRLAIGVLGSDGDGFTISHVTGTEVAGLEAGTVRNISDTNLEQVLVRGEILIQQRGKGFVRSATVPGESEGLASSLMVPLISRDRPIGFLAIRPALDDAYSNAQVALAQRIAVLAATAISNSELYERAEAEARERSVLAEIGRIVGSSLDIDSVYTRFADQVRELIEFDRISISYIDERQKSVVYAWAEGAVQTGFGIGREIPLKAFAGTRPGKLMSRRRPVVLSEAEIAEFLSHFPWANESSARSMIMVPLVSGDRPIAGLTLISAKPDAYGSREQELAARVGSQVAGAVANARLHAALREASEDLKDINTQKTELMTTIAHELRGPLTALRAFVDLVLEGAVGDVPVRQHEILTKASRSTTRMQNLLNVFSLLEMAEDQNVPLTVITFDIASVSEVAIELLQPAAAQAGVKIEVEGFDDLPLIEGDRQAIEQVISNLVSNAIKYSHQADVVSVCCEVRGEGVVVSVIDNGFGISTEDQGRLFERFYRGSDPEKLRIRGTGLGLYISRGLIERHHGRLWVGSKLGGGSVFSFSLPFEQPAEQLVASRSTHTG